MKKLLKQLKILGSAGLLSFLSLTAQATDLVIFSNGKVADANQINHNFNELATRITTATTTPGPKGDKGDPGVPATSTFNSSRASLALVTRLLNKPESASSFPYATLDSQTCSQKNAVFATATIAGNLNITISRLFGHEAISELFEFSFIGQSTSDIAPSTLIGSNGQIIIQTAIGSRSINGIVTKAGKTYAANGDAIYAINIEPAISQLKQTNDYKIFQQMNNSDIIQDIFQNAGFMPNVSLQNSGKIFDMSVMYNQSPFNYIQQLTETSGIAYFFNGSSIIFTDNNASYLDSGATLLFTGQNADISNLNTASQSYAFEYFSAQQNTATKFTSAGYDFQLADAAILNSQGNAASEKYSFSFIHTSQNDVSNASVVSAGRENTRKNQHYGSSNQPLIEAGYKFNINNKGGTLTGNYVATEVHHALTQSAFGSCLVYANNFNSLPSNIMFTPAIKTAKTKISGVTTAVVVGPAGETKYTDKYGRIKIQFHWDRQGSNNENSSAWVRLAVPVDRINDTLLYVPLIGSEVLVSFLHGDPSLPIVIGSLYNNKQLPALPLPANKFANGGNIVNDLPL